MATYVNSDKKEASGDAISLSSFNWLNKNSYTELINDINSNMTSNEGVRIQMNGEQYSVSGSPLKRNAASLDSGVTFIDNWANTFGNFAEGKKTSFEKASTGFYDSIGLNINGKNTSLFSGTNVKTNKPTTINLSSKGAISDKDNLNVLSSVTKTVTSWANPSSPVMTAFDKWGADVDKQLKKYALVQFFNLKTTDMVCSLFCLLMSLLPCELTNELAEDISKIKEASASLKGGVAKGLGNANNVTSMLNSMTPGNSNSGSVASVQEMTDAVNSLFKKNSGSDVTQSAKNTTDIANITAQLSLVMQILNLLLSLYRMSGRDKEKILNALVVNALYDLQENVLIALQAMAIGVVDKLINKVITPIEKWMNNNTFPSLCGSGAQVLFKKILEVIYNFKKKLLKYVAALFQFQSTKRIKIELFDTSITWTLELDLILGAIDLLLKHFLDIALACGVQKRTCGNNVAGTSEPTSLSQNYEDTGFTTETIPSMTNVSKEDPPTEKTVTEIAKKIEPLINSLFPGSTASLSSGMVTSKIENVPFIIMEALKDMPLGSDYTIYPKENSATIVYKRAGFCGA